MKAKIKITIIKSTVKLMETNSLELTPLRARLKQPEVKGPCTRVTGGY